MVRSLFWISNASPVKTVKSNDKIAKKKLLTNKMEADSDLLCNRFAELDGWRGSPAPRRHREPSVSANREKTGVI